MLPGVGLPARFVRGFQVFSGVFLWTGNAGRSGFPSAAFRASVLDRLFLSAGS